MENTEKPKRPRGRSPKEGVTERVILPVDEATCIKLDALIDYGGLGTSRSQIVMFILRLWLRENDTGLKAEIASKLAPFGNNSKNQT